MLRTLIHYVIIAYLICIILMSVLNMISYKLYQTPAYNTISIWGTFIFNHLLLNNVIPPGF